MFSGLTGFQVVDWPQPKATLPYIAVARVKAVALNPADYKVINNLSKIPFFRWVASVSPSYDTAGEIVSVGPYGCGHLKAGDAFFGQTIGSHREYALLYCPAIAKLPAKIPFTHGAAAVTVSYTAVHGLNRQTVVNSDSTLVIIGSAGGCGQAGIILAKLKKVKEVVCVASTKNREISLSKGCTKFYDYKDPNFEKSILKDYSGKVDVVYDTVSEPFPLNGPYVRKMVALLKPSVGKYITLTPNFDIWMVGYQKQHVSFTAYPIPEVINYVASHEEFFKDINIALQLEGLNITNIYRAYDLLESGRTNGKIVFTIGDQTRK
jgi:NADPH:quinone reductase-like Zn-dependent oxidoreductase